MVIFKRTLLFIFCVSILFPCKAQIKKKTANKCAYIPIESYYQPYDSIFDCANELSLYYKIHEWSTTKYCYSGRSKKGIDCSGFVSMLYKSVFCISLSGGSADIYKQMVPIKKEELKEGDLVFFKIKKGRVSHVGIYLSQNKFAHATIHSGITISDLDEAYYKKYFFAAARVKN